MKTCTVMWAVFLSCLVSATARAQVSFTQSPTVWALFHPAHEVFGLSGSDIQKSDEFDGFPANEQSLGPTLTFPSSATGLSSSFQVHTLTRWPLIFRNDLNVPFGTDAISSGNAQAQDGTDWEILFTGGQPVRGFAFNLIDNEDGADAVRVYNTAGTLIGTTSISDKHVFVGITSAVPIGRVVLDGDPTDFSAFNGLRFDQVPEPGIVPLALLACGLLLRRRPRRFALTWLHWRP